MTVQRVQVNGVDLAYRIDGAADKPWLVLSNSLATDMRLWDGQIEALTSMRRVLRYDTRGHGQSAATAAPYDFNLLIGDLIGLMDHLGLEKTDIGGLSLGGMTALGLALSHPSRITRVLCCDARADAPDAYVKMWQDRIAVVGDKGLAAVADGTLARWFTEGFAQAQNASAVIGLARTMILETSVAGYCGCAAALTGANFLPKLGQLTMPSHFIVGSEDLGVPPPVMQDMAQRAPAGRFHAIPHSAHLPNLEQPAAFNALILRCLS